MDGGETYHFSYYSEKIVRHEENKRYEGWET
jgi:hypothetical protein